MFIVSGQKKKKASIVITQVDMRKAGYRRKENLTRQRLSLKGWSESGRNQLK